MKKILIVGCAFSIFLVLIYQNFDLIGFGFGDITGWAEDRFHDVKKAAEDIGKETAGAIVTTLEKGSQEGAALLKKSEEFVTQSAGKINDAFVSVGGKLEDVSKEAISDIEKGGKDIAAFFKSCGSAAGLYAAYISATGALQLAQQGLKGPDVLNLQKAFDIANASLGELSGATDKFGKILQTLTGQTFNIKNFKIEGQIPTFNFQMNGILFGKNINVGAGVDFDSIKSLVLSLVQKILPQIADVAGLGLDLGNLLVKEVVQKI